MRTVLSTDYVIVCTNICGREHMRVTVRYRAGDAPHNLESANCNFVREQNRPDTNAPNAARYNMRQKNI